MWSAIRIIWQVRLLLIASVVSIGVAGGLLAQQASAQNADAASEISAALYAAAATQKAAEELSDQTIRAQRNQIEQLRLDLTLAQGQQDVSDAEITRLKTELATKQREFVDELARRDRAYAVEIAAFREAVEDIASTSEGAEALALFNAGNEIEALAILDDLEAGIARAEARAARIRSAERKRQVAALAMEARGRGKVSTADVLARYEEIVELDPDVFWDWIVLSRLRFDLGMSAGAEDAARRAIDFATDDRPRSIGLNELGNVQMAQGNLSGAEASYRSGLEIAERLASSDPGNAVWQGDLSFSFTKIGDVQVAQGDLSGADASYRSGLEIAERLASADPGNAARQRDLSVSFNKIGDVQVAQGDLSGAEASYRSSLEIGERLASADPGNAGWQRDLSVSFGNIGDVQLAQGDLSGAEASYRSSLEIAERLASADPGNAGWQRDLYVSHYKLAHVAEARGQKESAVAAYRFAIAVCQELAAARSDHPQYREECDFLKEQLEKVVKD